MERRGIFWVGVTLVLVFLAYLVPYTVLRGVDSVWGSFLFWSVFGFLAVLVNVAVSRGWRE